VNWKTSSCGAIPIGSTTPSTRRWVDKRAFVLSHGRDQLVFKIVGYAEQNVEYYKLEISAPTSGLPTSATRQRAACGTPAAPTRSWD